jgi:DNA-binding YbaB/EbfC family protein
VCGRIRPGIFRIHDPGRRVARVATTIKGSGSIVFNRLGMLADLMGNAGKLREAFDRALESLGQVEVEGDAGGGTVRAKVNGRLEVVSVHIDPKLLGDGDVELLEELVTVAVNAAMVKAREAAARSLSSLTGGLPLGMFPGFGGGGSPPTGPGAGGP